MERKIVVSIGRQFGAGGMSVGRLLADRLGYAYYDRELLLRVARDYGFAPEFFEEADEQSTHFFGNIMQWFESSMTGGYQSQNYLSRDELFKMQADTIRKLADEQSCVIVGRCSDYILRDNPNCVSVFLHSTDDDRVRRIVSRNSSITEDEARQQLRMADKKRAAYYNFYSNKTWGMSSTYSLSIDVASIGEEGAVDLIVDYLKKRFPDQSF